MSLCSYRYANARAPPLVDASQDIMDATAEEVMLNGSIYTIVSFTRPVSTGDITNDLALTEDAYILYAWGNELNFNANDSNSIAVHTGRGVSRMLISFLCPGSDITIGKNNHM